MTDTRISVVDVSWSDSGRVHIHLSAAAPSPMGYRESWDDYFTEAFQRTSGEAFTVGVLDDLIWIQASLEQVQTHKLVTRARKAVATANDAWNERQAEAHRRQLEKEQVEAEEQRHRTDMLAQIKREQLND